MIMCTGFNCIPCMPLSSVLTTPAQKRPFYELSLDIVQDVFYVLSLGPHFCHPIPSFDKGSYRGWMGIDHFIESTSPKLWVAAVSANRSKHRPRNSPAKTPCKVYGLENCWLSKKDRVLPPWPDPIIYHSNLVGIHWKKIGRKKWGEKEREK